MSMVVSHAEVVSKPGLWPALTIYLDDGIVTVKVGAEIVWVGTIGQWSFALANRGGADPR